MQDEIQEGGSKMKRGWQERLQERDRVARRRNNKGAADRGEFAQELESMQT